MPKRTVRIARRQSRKPIARTGSGCGCKKPRRVRKRGAGRLKNSRHIRKWMSHRAKPWMVKGSGFWQDFGKGFTSVFKPFATIGGPILDAVGMPEFGMPLSAVGNMM